MIEIMLFMKVRLLQFNLKTSLLEPLKKKKKKKEIERNNPTTNFQHMKLSYRPLRRAAED